MTSPLTAELSFLLLFFLLCAVFLKKFEYALLIKISQTHKNQINFPKMLQNLPS